MLVTLGSERVNSDSTVRQMIKQRPNCLCFFVSLQNKTR